MDVKQMVQLARAAQKEFDEKFTTQEQVDLVVMNIAKALHDNAENISRIAIEETKMGVYEDKVAKTRNKAKAIWYDLRDKKSVGVISEDPVTGLIEIAKPMGVIAAITPTTNPGVTPMSNIMFAVKTKNAIIVAPHPRSKKTSTQAIAYIKEKILPLGVPENLIQIIDEPSIASTNALMEEADVIVATGGMAMVKAAYSSGKPSFGVGAGNVQVIIDRDVDFHDAAEKIIAGRKFDNGIICSGEQTIIAHRDDYEQVLQAFTERGAYVVRDEAERERVVNVIFENGHLAKDVVGQSPAYIAERAGITLPEGTKIIVVEAKGIGTEDVVCKEKMCPVMASFRYDTIDEAIAIAKANLNVEGNGHSAAVHSNTREHVERIGQELSVSRLIVNATSATTAGGSIQNGLAATNTLGCGSWGNNSISENLTYKHLMNITRVAPIRPEIRIPTDEEIWELDVVKQ